MPSRFLLQGTDAHPYHLSTRPRMSVRVVHTNAMSGRLVFKRARPHESDGMQGLSSRERMRGWLYLTTSVRNADRTRDVACCGATMRTQGRGQVQHLICYPGASKLPRLISLAGAGALPAHTLQRKAPHSAVGARMVSTRIPTARAAANLAHRAICAPRAQARHSRARAAHMRSQPATSSSASTSASHAQLGLLYAPSRTRSSAVAVRTCSSLTRGCVLACDSARSA